MFIQNLGKRERILFAVCVALIAVGIIYSLMVEPVIRRWKRLSQEIEAKEASLAKDLRLLAMHKTLESEYEKYRGIIELSKNEEEEQAKALTEIENISKKSGCHIFNIKPHASREVGAYKELTFEVTAGGTIEAVSKFLYEVEASNERLRVKHFVIASQSGSTENLKGSFFINKIILL